MLETRKSTILTGSSSITSENDNRIYVVNMTANISDDGNINFSKSIMNKELYLANKEVCDNDIDAFEQEALRL